MTRSVKIRVGAASAIELSSAGALKVTQSGNNVTFEGYDTLDIHKDGKVLRWRVPARVPDHVGPSDAWKKSSWASSRYLRQAGADWELNDGGEVDFAFYLNSPLTPLGRGVRVELQLQRKGNTFDIDDSGTSLWFCAAGGNWQKEGTSPNFSTFYDGSWEYWNSGTSAPGQDNRLLSLLPPHADACLVDLGRRRQETRDHRFQLLPQQQGNLRVVATHLYVSDSDTNPVDGLAAAVRISGQALRLDDTGGSTEPLLAEKIDLVCVERDDRSGWQLRWRQVLGNGGGNRLSLASLSRLLCRHFPLGLAATRARNRLSFAPTQLASDGRIELEFSLDADAQRNLARTQLAAVRLPKDSLLTMSFGGAVDVTGQVPRLTTTVGDPLQRPGWCCYALQPAGAGPELKLAVGAVAVDATQFEGGYLCLSFRDDSRHYSQPPLGLLLQLKFAQARYRALSVDPELGFETLSAAVKRERPWALDLSDDTPGCRLDVNESASRQQSRLLQLQLRLRDGDQGSVRTDVVIVDRSPLTIARVRTLEAPGRDGLLAEYTDDADQAPEWRFHSPKGEMSVILPPQGIGEEMIKGRLHLTQGDPSTRVPRDGRPFDFRLTPPALLRLDRSDTDTARSEAPWSLRRLLAQRLGVTGVRLLRARLELLYGLQLDVTTPDLRLVELDGMTGRIPFGTEMSELLRTARVQHDAPVNARYAAALAEWIASLWHRPSWWRVVRDATRRERLVLDEGIAYSLRTTRQTANPFDIGRFAVGDDPQLIPPDERTREPLRGGVDWPFQSPNIYSELLRDAKPGTGSVEGLAFGALGGEAEQTAAFNNGKTLIITRSRQGRLDAVTLIRVGRIGMLWNRARHVIVYERTTRRADRYGKEPADPTQDSLEFQPEFKGFAALRKVREYVEITEPRRRYPDTPQERPLAGPLQQSVFDSTVIPVKSSWGRDIPDGFVIALRGPVADDEDRFFPFPNVFLDFARAAAKGDGSIAQRIRNPQQLQFFTSTRDQDSGDSDSWPAWPDVDFPLLQPPSPPKVPFAASFSGTRRQPSAAPADAGMARFTLDLEAAEEAVNLMHGRPVAGLDARLFNICLARGRPSRPLPETSLSSRLATGIAMFDAIGSDALLELQTELQARAATQSGVALRDLPQLQADARRLVARLREASKGVHKPAPGAPAVAAASWSAAQKQRLDDYAVAVRQQAQRAGDQVRQDIHDLGNDLERARRRATGSVETLCVGLSQKVREVGFVPDLARGAARQGGRAVHRQLQNLLRQLRQRADDALNDLERRIGSGASDADALDAHWQGVAATLIARLDGFLAEIEAVFDAELGQWFSRRSSGSATLFVHLRRLIDGALAPVLDWFRRWLADLPPFSLGWPDLGEMRQQVARLLDPVQVDDFAEVVEKWIKENLAFDQAAVDAATTDAADKVGQWCNDATAALLGATNLAQIERLLGEVIDALDDCVDSAVDGLMDGLNAAFAHMDWKDLEGSWAGIDELAGTVDKALDAIDATLDRAGATLADLAREAEREAALIRDDLKASIGQLETLARNEARALAALGKEAADAGLETLRALAEGPVTDTLRASRDALGYYYDQAKDALDVTRASAYFNDLGTDVLNALSVDLPFDRIRDRLLPQLTDFAVRDLLPDFGGLKLSDLLPDLEIPVDGEHEYGWVRLAHGFDRNRLTAWAKVDIDKEFEDDATLFDLGPVKLRLLEPHFIAHSEIEVDRNGARAQRTSAQLQAHWELSLGDKPMVTMRDGLLTFDESGELKFEFDSEKLELAQELQFVTDALRSLMPEVEGLTITPMLPSGISAELSLPLPDIGTGAFTLTGITLNAHLDLLIGNGFEIRTGLWLSKPDRPFGLAVLFLGGGGWFGIDVSYRPPSQFVTRVSVGLSAGAFLAVNFGFARGSAGLLFTAGLDFYRDWSSGKGSTALSIGILMWGEFSILGIASASIRLVMRITYADGAMTGYGVISVSIRICWCYTLRLSRQIAMPFAKPGRRGGSTARAAPLLETATTNTTPPVYGDRPPPAADAVGDHFSSLAL